MHQERRRHSPAMTRRSTDTAASEPCPLIGALQSIAAELDLDTLTATIPRVVLGIATARRASLLLPRSNGTLTLAAEATTADDGSAVPRAFDAAASPASSTMSSAARVVQTHRRELVAGVHDSAPRSLLCLPVVWRDELHAVLALESDAEPDTFTPELLAALDALAAQAAIAMGHARRHAALKRENVERAVADAARHESERKAEALRESEAKYRSLYTRTPVMMHSIDPMGRLVSVSDAWLESLGYERDEVLGRASVDLMTPESRLLATEVILPDFFRTGVCKDVHYQLVKKSGEIMDVLLSGIAERDPQGNVSRSLAVLIDVTEKARMERRLRENESGRRLLQDQLRQAQKMEALGRLAGGVAHDFNNLLMVILVQSDLLIGQLDEQLHLQASVQDIKHAAERAATLTAQLLAFSRKQMLEPKVLELNEVVANLDRMLQRVIGEDVGLVARVAPDLGRVKVDRSQLEQVIVNLVVNARDAMSGGGCLTIETRNVELDLAGAQAIGDIAEGAYVVLEVSDTGSGIDPRIQARIFEPFFTTKEPGKGTGLGLATVHGIVHQSGGAVSVASRPGAGSTFSVFLPRVFAAATPSRGEASRPQSTGSQTILLVEDEDAVRGLLGTILRDHGYTALAARSGAEALCLARDHSGPIHLLFTDRVMPGMSGSELAVALHAQRPDTRVLFMSGYAEDVVPDAEPAVAEAPFLAKPFSIAALVEKVRQVLSS